MSVTVTRELANGTFIRFTVESLEEARRVLANTTLRLNMDGFVCDFPAVCGKEKEKVNWKQEGF